MTLTLRALALWMERWEWWGRHGERDQACAGFIAGGAVALPAAHGHGQS